MKKLLFALSIVTFLVATISMMPKNHAITTKKATAEKFLIKNEVVLEERP